MSDRHEVLYTSRYCAPGEEQETWTPQLTTVCRSVYAGESASHCPATWWLLEPSREAIMCRSQRCQHQYGCLPIERDCEPTAKMPGPAASTHVGLNYVESWLGQIASRAWGSFAC